MEKRTNRRLLVKEIKRIQTFPDWYEFSTGNSNKLQYNSKLDKIYKQVGNAVPVLLAKSIAQPIADWVVQYVNEKEAQSNQLRLPV